ncbi:DUF808 domain-containing protein [uncultured Corynebacterium sp.]|uniref:DUF808 domain-containing protein n=1 Tax=uncultured Corynebacterium sp. TaxID=159447 RepID=UPI0025F9F817|nr:DUF808 domain-containing protein [uncultured Corynebacterium sp.]
MSGGLAALLDDVAALARAAAASADDIAAATGKAGAKAAGVVIDDAAVTPQYVTGIEPKRELPMIWRIAKGSLVNKLVIILPIALLLSQFLPWVLTPILMLGGSYLCFEGMEKVWEKISHKLSKETPEEKAAREAEALDREPADEDSLVKSAIFTDLILSAEIMVISLNEVANEPFVRRAIILIVVALAITLLVYGVVGLLVKMDDIGLAMAKRSDGAAGKFGSGLVKAMPVVLSIIGIIGTFAMLWVGGHIILVGVDELGWHAPYEFVHHLETLVPAGFLAWCVNTLCSLVIGAIWGAILVAVMHFLPFGHGKGHGGDHDDSHGTAKDDGHGDDSNRSSRIRASAGSATPGGLLVDRDAKSAARKARES